MHRQANPSKVAKSTKATQVAKVSKKTSKLRSKKSQKRAFSSSRVPTHDPRFSQIDADVCRASQAAVLPETTITNGKNGLRVAHEAQAGGLVTVGVFIDAGSRYENTANHGTAHFLEHMLFKGTAKRTRTQLETEIENMGGIVKSKTGREHTYLTATVQQRHMKEVVELLGDVITNSKITETDVEAERSVVLQKMQREGRNLECVVMDNMHGFAYRGSSLAHGVMGSGANVAAISKAQLDSYVKTHFIAPRITVAAVGDIEEGEFTAAALKHFGDLPDAPTNGIVHDVYGRESLAPSFIGGSYNHRDDDFPKVHLAVGFETKGYNSEDYTALQVLQTMFGSYHFLNAVTDQYHSSALVSTSAQQSLADSINPFSKDYADTGLMGFYAVADPNKIDLLGTDLVRHMIYHSTNVPEQSLIEARNKLKLQIANKFEGPQNTCTELGHSLLQHGRRVQLHESFARIEDVDQAAIQHVVKKHFVDQDFVISALGNTFELQDYPLLRKKTYLPWM